MNFPFPPSTPCASCLADPARQAFGQDGSMVALHCHHNRAGAVLRTHAGIWTVISPIDVDGFADYCARLGALQAAVINQQDGASQNPKH